MSGDCGNIVPTHRIDRINGLAILKTSRLLGPENVLVYTLRVSPFGAVFYGIPSFIIGMTTAGSLRGECALGNTVCQIELPPNTIFTIPPNTSFEARINTGAEVIAVYIAHRLFKQVQDEFLIAGGNQSQLGFSYSRSDTFLEQTIRYLKEIVERGGTFARIETEYLARVITARIMAKPSDQFLSETNTLVGLPDYILRDIVNYIDRNLDRRITPARLSAMAGLGPAQFTRLFKRSTNVTLHQYIILQRIERARNLLRDTDMPIIEIAQECGFADQVHLTRFFNRINGTSPASFRRRTREKLFSRPIKL